MDDQLKSFLQYVFQMVEEGGARIVRSVNLAPCAQCGVTYDALRKTGKAGCANCYQAFREQISQILHSVHHGATRHTGKVPYGEGGLYSDVLTKREIEKTRGLLDDAVKSEAFEDAARYRDMILELEKKMGVGADA
ncbi:MAG: UvrB/UvrC motif-containing protein [Defluviitaleaceae bacterium]|nr:UvrB/UvrC motif-containing protein [Defluviitaleaceae bacterium]